MISPSREHAARKNIFVVSIGDPISVGNFGKFWDRFLMYFGGGILEFWNYDFEKDQHSKGE